MYHLPVLFWTYNSGTTYYSILCSTYSNSYSSLYNTFGMSILCVWMIPIMLPYLDLIDQMKLIPIMISYSDRSSLPLLLHNHWIIGCHVYHDNDKDSENIEMIYSVWSVHNKTNEKSESVQDIIECHITKYKILSQISMTTPSLAQDAHLIWISIWKLLIMILLSYNQWSIHRMKSTVSLFLHCTLLIDHSMANGIRCSILTQKICSRSMIVKFMEELWLLESR